MWKKLTLFVAFPVIILGHVQAFMTGDGSAHRREEFIPYDYMRIRNKVSRGGFLENRSRAGYDLGMT